MLLTALGNGLRHAPLCVGGSLLRVRLDEPRAYAYPDVVVWGDDASWSDAQHDTLLSPLLLAEVVTRTTRERGLKWKLDAYRRVPSLTHYLILWPNQVKVEHHVRTRANEWLSRTLLRRSQTLFLADLGTNVQLQHIYTDPSVPEGTLDVELPFDDDDLD